MKKVKLAVVGVGNCASSLIQGIEYYGHHHNEHSDGIMQPQINGWRPQDIKIVAAFDIDKRKVGLPISKAIFAEPNCTTVFQKLIPVNGVGVKMGPLLDGMADHMKEYPESRAFRVADVKPVNVVEEVFFFHKETKTLIITDFIQSIHPYHNLFERMMGRIGGIYNNPSPPRDLRLMMRLDRQTTKHSVERVKQWRFDKIIIAHGQLITRDARIVFNKAFDWI